MQIKKFILLSTVFFSGLSFAQTKIIITHAEVPPPTLLDHGKPGQSIGDVRLWQFPAKANDGTNITIDWIMTTTGIVKDMELEYRITSAVFSFGDGTNDQIGIQGVAKYPSVKATLKESEITKRAITGGTGKFGGIGGWVETEHLTNGT
jgi:hypothetical protein